MTNKTGKPTSRGDSGKHPVACSFCGKSEPEVKKVIAVGEKNKPICNECIATCTHILTDSDKL